MKAQLIHLKNDIYLCQQLCVEIQQSIVKGAFIADKINILLIEFLACNKEQQQKLIMLGMLVNQLITSQYLQRLNKHTQMLESYISQWQQQPSTQQLGHIDQLVNILAGEYTQALALLQTEEQPAELA